MSDFLKKLHEKIYLTKQLAPSKINYVKWVGVQPVQDKNRHGTKTNPNNIEVIYLVIIFEMKIDLLDDIDNDITLDMGEHVERIYLYSIQEVIDFLTRKGININDFKPRSRNMTYPL